METLILNVTTFVNNAKIILILPTLIGMNGSTLRPYFSKNKSYTNDNKTKIKSHKTVPCFCPKKNLRPFYKQVWDNPRALSVMSRNEYNEILNTVKKNHRL